MHNRLKEFRAKHNMTQENLAERAGLSRQSIVAIEKGRFDPKLETAFTLARIFEVKVEDLFKD
jgi:putative transcriptional regulator